MKIKKMIAALMTLVILTNVIPIAHAAPAYYPACSQSHTSIVDALLEVGEASDYATRAKIAAANDIASYSGTYQQNLTLLSLLKSSQLRRPGAAVSTSSKSDASFSQSSVYYPSCSQNHTSIVDALVEVGEASDYATRAKIAAANDIASYSGTYQQNLMLLSLLKSSQLRRPGAAASASSKPNTSSASITPPLSGNYFSAFPKTYANLDATEVLGFRGEVFVSVKENAPVRSRPNKTGNVLYKLEEGEPVQAISVLQNRVGNRWIQLFIPDGSGKIGYLYIGNTKKHEHSFVDLADYGYEGYKACTGCATVVNTEPAEISVDNIHFVLALLSMEQTIGNAFDVLDGLVFLAEGDVASASFSFAAAIPWLAGKVDALQLGKASSALVQTTIRGVDVASAITKVGNNAIQIVSRANTKVLARNMEAAFLKSGDFRFFKWSDQIDMASKSWAAHHIVAGNAQEAESARQILKAVGIDINAAENGVYLCMKSGVCNGTIHAGGHSNAYYEAVNEALTTAYESYYTMSEKKAAVIAALNDIAVQLRKGDLRL